MSLKNNKYARRLAAALMTGTMMVSMLGMTAMAEGNNRPSTPIDEVKFTKTIDLGSKKDNADKIFVPNASFQFEVAPIDFLEQATSITEGGKTIYEGIAGGVSFENGADTIAFTPDESPSEADFSKETTLSIDITKFTNPGIYRYEVKEIESTDNKYDGMTYDTTARTLDVYVMTDNSGLYVGGVILGNQNAGNHVKTTTITNKYATHELTIEKEVTGSQGAMDVPFEFAISISGATGEKYYLQVYDKDNSNATVGAPVIIDANNDMKSTFALTDNQYAVVYGLSENDEYTVIETAAGQDGYSTSISGVLTGITGNKQVQNKIGNADVTITYTNDRDVAAPTGVILNIAPYILMVALAGVLAFFFLRKRRYDL